MALKKDNRTQPTASVLICFGLTSIYVGERLFTELERYIISGLGLSLMLFGACFFGIMRWANSTGERRMGHKRLLQHYTIIFAGLLLYLLQNQQMGWLRAEHARHLAHIGIGGLLLLGLAPMVAVEMALKAIGNAPKIEAWRIHMAARSARVVIFSWIAFAGLNYAANKWNKKIDLSYFKTSQVGTANHALVQNLSEQVRMILFFPPGNEVLELVRDYADELSSHHNQLKVEILDQALHPTEARKFKVRANGYIALARGDKNETMRVGLQIEKATSILRKLDSEIHKRLVKILKPPRIAYFTTGHLERDHTPAQGDERPGLSDLKRILTVLGIQVRRLGLGDGLGSEVPKDASVVVVAGPSEPFMPAELDTLTRYLNTGGRALFLIDPDHGTSADELLKPLGVQVSTDLVATDNLRHSWRLKGQNESPFNITTHLSSTHPSIESFAKARGRLGLLATGAGSITKVQNGHSDFRPSFTLRAMSDSWLDTQKNGLFDKETEKRQSLDLGVALEKEIKTANDDSQTAVAHGPARAIVFSDADIVADVIIRNQGNMILISDAFRWLLGDEAESGLVESEGDIRIVHRQDEDAFWFYGSAVLMPLAVMSGGLFYSRRRRRK
jgi:hypothetical protein